MYKSDSRASIKKRIKKHVSNLIPPLEPSGAQVPTLGAERHRRQWRHQYLRGV